MAHILVIPGSIPGALEAIDPSLTVHKVNGFRALMELVGNTPAPFQGILTGGALRIDEAILGRFPKLEIIASCGAGYDKIDMAACNRGGVVVTYTPDVVTEEVADASVGLLIMTIRELGQAERYLRAGLWAKEGPFRLVNASLRNRSVGIVGLGKIGLAIAKRLEAFGVPIAYFSRRPQSVVRYHYYSDLLELARNVDTLIVCLPLSPDTKHMIDMAVLRALGPKGVLINIGRGSVVDEAALATALESNVIYGAGLDVFENEPKVHPVLLNHERVVLLPHVGSGTKFTREAVGKLAAENLNSWFRERRLLTPVPEIRVAVSQSR